MYFHLIVLNSFLKSGIRKLYFNILSDTQLKRLEVIQNEGMRTILGCTKDTSAEAMRYLLDFQTMRERHRMAQVTHIFTVMDFYF